MDNISLKDFLKKYTAISDQFINNYFIFYDKCELNKFGIELEKTLDYLDIKGRKEFYTRFRNKYILNSDYIIKRHNQKKEKDIKDTEYYISFDTFEKICMASKAPKAEKVRDYFITLRKFIDYYKNHISNMILQKAKTNPSKCIYILLINKNKNILKLGQTKELRKRLRTYATGMDTHPDIKFIMLVDDPKIVENCMKIFLEKFEYKKNHEIYKININIIKKIAFDCSGVNNELNQLMLEQDDKYAYVVFDDISLNNNTVYKAEKQVKQSLKKQIKKTSKKSTKKTSKK
jgi:phage anti-repressor protein